MSSLREALESALVENPDDLAAHMAYADHLHDQGDPRGELIQVQLALEDETLARAERERLAVREKELLGAHLRDWLGDLAPDLLDQAGVSEWRQKRSEGNHFRFRRGWIEEVDLVTVDLDRVQALIQNPALRLLRALAIAAPTHMEEGEDLTALGFAEHPQVSSVLFHLTAAPWLGGLRQLRIGEDDRREDYDHFNCKSYAEGIHHVVARTPLLESLCLFAHLVETEKLFVLPSLGHLRELVVFHLHEYAWQALADNPALGNLGTIFVHPGHLRGDQSPTGLDAIRPLLHSPHLKSLRHLGLRISDMGDAGCAELVASGILERLRTLDLRHGCIGDEGARILASASVTAHLDKLDLEDNQLTEVGITALMEARIALFGDLDSQHEPDDNDWRYMADIE